MKLEKRSDTRRYTIKGGSEKYYIQCNPEKLKELDPFDMNHERVILKALLDDSIIRTNSHVVVKIGESSTIKKEWDIGRKIQKSIPGFIKYICIIQCHDNLGKYSKPKFEVCTQNSDDPIMNVLVMPYIAGGSMREFPWDKNIDKFKSCFKQLICSLLCAFEMYGFLHTDIHLGNVLVRETKKTHIHYDHLNITIPTCGVQICIMDFEHAFIGVDGRSSSMFYKDINHALGDVLYHLKLQFSGFEQIYAFVSSRMFYDASVREILQMLDKIDSMDYLGLSKPKTIVYNPNVL